MRKRFFIASFVLYLGILFTNVHMFGIACDGDQATRVTLLAPTSAMPTFIEERLLTVVLMVKDEEAAMEKTLKPLVDGGIQSFFIFDTGSTDRTIEVTQEFFKAHNIERACIVQEPFVNFEVSRNRALDLAEQVFPRAVFMLMPDAEWYLYNVEGLLKFCEQERYGYSPSYSIRLTNGYEDFRRTCVARVRSKTRYVGATHEVMIPETGSQVPSDVYFKLCTTHYGQEKSRRRWVRDLDLLLKQYEKNSTPDYPDTRSMFYIAQTYACLGDWENAYHWYELRSQHHGWDEEDFITVYRLAQAAEQLSYTHEAYTWALAHQHYIEAHKMRPHRIEPLIKLADHYWDVGNYAACYLFAKRASEIPYPEQDVLFVETKMYEFYRYEILSKSAWYVQEYAVGEWATRMALEVHPDQIHLHTNLGFYMSVKEKNDACFAIN
jgi:hypothetical protein